MPANYKWKAVVKMKKRQSVKKKKSSIMARISRAWLLMCLPAVLLVFVFKYIPMFGVIMAFKNYTYDKGIFGSPWVGFKNFEFFFKSDAFLTITWNTLRYNAIFIITGVIAALVVALLLYEVSGRGRTKAFQTILITPNFMSWVVMASMVYALLQPTGGFINVIIKSFGGEAVNWYGKPEAWNVILPIANIWKIVGMDSVMFYAALMGVDHSILEAAKIDGANRRQTMLKVLLPCITPMILTLTVLKVGNIFRADFGMFYQLPRNIGILYPTTDVIDTYIYRSMRTVGDMGMSTAIGLLQSVVGFIVVMMANKVTKKIDPNSGIF